MDNGGPPNRVDEARQKVLAIFGHDPHLEKNLPEEEQRQAFEMPAPGTSYINSSPDSTPEPTPDATPVSSPEPEPASTPVTTSEPSALKDTPMNQTAVDEQWREYHSAWQNYYQQYYSDYYSKAAQTYLETEKLKDARIATGKAREKRRIRHLAPLIAGICVVFLLLFLQYNRLIFAPIMAYISPDSNSVSTTLEAIDPTATQAISPDPRLIIPKLNVDVPVAFGIDYTDVMKAMETGVAQFMIPGANAMPGQVGNLVISGHSAGDIYSNTPYKFIFSGLERLVEGDLIYINYESVRYTYRMTGSKVVEPSDVAALIYPTDRPILTLITCTPLGTSRYRLLVSAEQISPDYDSTNLPEDAVHTDSNYSMPSNQPTFIENVWNNVFGESE